MSTDRGLSPHHRARESQPGTTRHPRWDPWALTGRSRAWGCGLVTLREAPHLCVSSSAVSQFRCPRFMAHSCMPSHPFLAPKCFGKSALLNVSSMPGFALCTLCTNLLITCFYFCMYWVSVPCICSSLEEELCICPHCPVPPTPPGSPQRPSQPLSARGLLGTEAGSASPASSQAPRPSGLGPRGNVSSPLLQAPSSPVSTSSRAGASGWLCGLSCCSPCSVMGWCC